MARNKLEKLRDCRARGGPEISWQPEFDRAGEALERSAELKPSLFASGGSLRGCGSTTGPAGMRLPSSARPGAAAGWRSTGWPASWAAGSPPLFLPVGGRPRPCQGTFGRFAADPH